MRRSHTEPQKQDTYWQEDIPLFAGLFPYFHNKPRAIRAKIHRAEEQYFDGQLEIVPMTTLKGECTLRNVGL